MKRAVCAPKGPENCKMGQRARRFCRIKNKEQGREKQKRKEEQGNKYRVQTLLGAWELADWIYSFWSTRPVQGYKDFGFCVLMWPLLTGVAPSWAGISISQHIIYSPTMKQEDTGFIFLIWKSPNSSPRTSDSSTTESFLAQRPYS